MGGNCGGVGGASIARKFSDESYTRKFNETFTRKLSLTFIDERMRFMNVNTWRDLRGSRGGYEKWHINDGIKNNRKIQNNPSFGWLIMRKYSDRTNIPVNFRSQRNPETGANAHSWNVMLLIDGFLWHNDVILNLSHADWNVEYSQCILGLFPPG